MMLAVQQVLIFLVVVSAMYALMVTVCVSGRMTRSTKHVIRWPVIFLGGLASWALLRTATGNWGLSVTDIGHAVTVISGAVALAMMPRIPT